MKWWETLVGVVVLLAVGFGLQACIKAVASDSCDERGGHLERVYGGRGGWVCDVP